MINKSILICLILLATLLGSCKAFNGNKWDVATTTKEKKDLSSSLTSVNVANNLVTIRGTGFANVTSVQLKGTTLDTSLSINSKSDSQIIASASSAISLLAGETFKLIIGTAEAQVSYDITFTLLNGAIQLSHLSTLGATTAGQILKFNGTSWAPSFFTSSQNYKGTWNPNTNTPDDITSIGSYSPGDYYIVSSAGTFTSGTLTTSPTTFAVGNWVMFNGLTWDKVLNGNLSGSGTTNYIPYYSSANILANSPLVVSGSNIGIGNTSPGSSLDVKGTLRLSGATSGYVGIAPAAVAGGTTYTLPAADGTNGQVLKTNGAGILSWTSVSVSGGTVTAVSSANTDISVANGTSTPVLTLNSGTSANQIVKLTAASKLPAVDGSLLTNLTSTNLVGAVPVANGGTGATTLGASQSALGITLAGSLTGNVPSLGTSLIADRLCASDSTGGTISCNNNLPAATVKNSVLGTSGSGNLLFGTSPTITTPVITSIAPGGDFTLSQNGVAPFTSINSGAVANTLYLNAGKVGIGTTNPGAQLEISTTGSQTLLVKEGTATGMIIKGVAGNNSGNADFILSSANSSTTGGSWDIAAVDASAKFTLYDAKNSVTPFIVESNTPTNTFYLKSTGNVGIGTSVPTHSLTLNSTSSGYANYNTSDQTTNYERGVFKWVGNTYLVGTEFGGGGQVRTMRIGAGGTAGGDVSTGRTLDFQGSTPFYKINAATALAGNIFDFSSLGLVGANVSQAAMAINPTINQTGTSSYTALLINPTEAAIGSGTQRLIDAQVASTSKFYIKNDGTTYHAGNVGIGTSTPAGILDVEGGSAAAAANATPIKLVAQTAGTGNQNGGDIILLPSDKTGTGGNGGVLIGTSTNPGYLNSNSLFVQGFSYLNGGVNAGSGGYTLGDGTKSIGHGGNGATGYVTIVTNSTEKLRVDANGNVGIGKTAPVQKLDVNGNINIPAGGEVSFNNEFSGFLRYDTFYTAGSLFNFKSWNGSLVATNMVINSTSGNVGIGTTGPNDKLEVSGEVRVASCVKNSGGTAIAGTCSSDERFKKDIIPIGKTLDLVTALEPVRYHWRTDEFPNKHWGEQEELGLIAQQVKKVVPELVEKDSDGYYRVRYYKIPMLVLGAIKELSNRFTNFYGEFKTLIVRVMNLEEKSKKLEAETFALKKENHQLKIRLEKIEKILEKTK